MQPQSSQWYLRTKISEPWAYIKQLFTAAECRLIIDRGLNLPRHTAQVESNEIAGTVNAAVRQNSLGWFNSSDQRDHWIFQRLAEATDRINQQFWKFDLDYIECLQFTIYDQPGDGYRRHIDTVHRGIHTRKLSFSLQLTDPSTYQGCDLLIEPGCEEQAVDRDQGTLIVFPSYTTHRVSALSQGIRYSLVGWCCGPAFR